MKGLLKKDILHIRTAYMSLLPYLVFMTLMSAVSAFVKGSIVFVALPGMAVFQAVLPAVMIMDDNRTGYDRMVLTMPVDRKVMVTEKYALALVNAFLSGIFFMAVTVVCAVLGGNSVLPSVSGGILITVCSLFASVVMLPLIYCVSTENMKWVYIGGLLLFGGMTGLVIAVLKLSGRSLRSSDVSVGTSAALLAVTLVLTAVSCLISVYFYNKKDI